MQYLGTAGFVFSSQHRDIVVDPFVTRPSLLTTIREPLRSDTALLQQLIPKADEVLIGHAHHDHVLDAPELCMQTGARLIGSPDVCRIGHAAGVSPHQIVETNGRERISCGEHCSVMGFPSVHGRVYLNRVTLPGNIAPTFQWPSRLWNFRHGLVLNWLVEMDGLRIMHIDSADFLESEVKNVQVDVLCLCAIGRQWRKNYIADAIRIFQPKLIIGCHWDWFFTPFEGPHYLLPRVDLSGFVREIKAHGGEPVIMPIGGTIDL